MVWGRVFGKPECLLTAWAPAGTLQSRGAHSGMRARIAQAVRAVEPYSSGSDRFL